MAIMLMLFVAIVAFAAADNTDRCPDGVPRPIDHLTFTSDKKCYRYSGPADKKIWIDAQQSCKAQGGDLVTIPTPDVQQTLNSRLQALGVHLWENIWIGLRDVDKEGDFVWVNGQHVGNYTNWGLNLPQAARFGDCVTLSPVDGYHWHYTNCDSWSNLFHDHTYSYICEYDLLEETFVEEEPAIKATTARFVEPQQNNPSVTTSP